MDLLRLFNQQGSMSDRGPNQRLQRRVFLALLFATAAALLHGCRQNSPSTGPRGMTTTQEISSAVQQMIAGDWQRAEVIWGETRSKMQLTNSNMMQFWIDRQVDIVDGVARHPQKLLLRKLAFQELLYFPAHSVRHHEWLRNKAKNQEFSDPDMQAQLKELLEDLEKRFPPNVSTNSP